MADKYTDPSGNTQAFRVFAQGADPAAEQPTSKLPLIVGGVVVGAVLLALVAWLALG
jgi:hypothetical protein